MKQLDHILEQYKANIYNKPALHGLYTALICTPAFYMAPAQQANIIFGTDNIIWNDENHIAIFMNELVDLGKDLINIFNNKLEYKPLYYNDNKNQPIIEDWVTGFVLGVQCLPNFWKLLLEDEEYQELLRPIIILYELDNLPLDFLQLPKSKNISRDQCINLITLNIPKIHDYFYPYKRNFSEHVFSYQKAGRNDPCPCGSGTKYKKCCIDITF